MKKIDWLILFFFALASLFLLKDLFKPGLYTSHDGIHQVVRFFYFDQAIADGQIPPRWAQGLLNSFGYPLFIFSYHLPWVISEIFRVLGFSIIDSVKYTFLAGFIFSGVTMYLLQKDIFGRIAALAGTALYLLAPYRFSNIFVRASIGDATSFIFAPLVFWSLFKLKEKPFDSTQGRGNWKWIVLGSLGTAGLILSHAMVAALFLSVFALYFLLSLAAVKNKISYIKSSVLTILFGLGVSAYYFIPSLIERGDTKFQELMSQIFTGKYFPDFGELIYSKWGYGVFHSKEGAMSVQLGLIQWFVVLASALFILKIFIFDKKLSKETKNLLKEGIILAVLFAFTILMMLPVSLPIWKTASSFVFVDFPWRYLAVSVFLVSILTGYLIKTWEKGKIILAALFIISALYLNRNHLRINETLPWDLSFILKLEKTTNTYDEYTPKWVKNDFILENKPKVEFPEGKADIEILKNKSNLLEFSLNPQKEGMVRINTIYYPGWKVWVEGKEEKIDYSNGLIEFKVGEGKKTVLARFTETPVRMISNIITLVTLALLFLLQLPILKRFYRE